MLRFSSDIQVYLFYIVNYTLHDDKHLNIHIKIGKKVVHILQFP